MYSGACSGLDFLLYTAATPRCIRVVIDVFQRQFDWWMSTMIHPHLKRYTSVEDVSNGHSRGSQCVLLEFYEAFMATLTLQVLPR